MYSKVLDANVDESALTLNQEDVGCAVLVDAAGNLGGGTLNIRYRKPKATGTPNTWLALDSAIALGHQQIYYVGSGMEIGVELTGATAPSVDVKVTRIPG